MTRDKNFKRVVRNEMAATGERYTDARERLGGRPDSDAPRRIMGSEVRYSGLASSETTRAPSPPEVARYLFRRVVSWGRSSNVYLQNGARLYIAEDGVMEYAGPECDSVHQVVVHAAAGDAIMRGLAGAAVDRLREEGVEVEVRVLRDSGPMGGAHESYSLAEGSNLGLTRIALTPFLVARQLLTGAGAVLTSERGHLYALARRPEFVWSGNDFGHVRDERTRLHVNCADANRSEQAALLRFGATALALRVLEERPDLVELEAVQLDEPIRAIRQVSHDTSGRRPVALASGQTKSALDLLTLYLTAVKGLLASAASTPDERAAVALWERCLGWFEADDHAQLARVLDWPAKRKLIEDEAGRIGAPDALLIDAHFAQVWPEVDSPEFDRVGSQREADRAGPPHYEAPQTTRARLRSEFIKKGIATRRDYTVDWTHLKLNPTGAQRTIVVKDPFAATDPRVDRLIAAMDDAPPSTA